MQTRQSPRAPTQRDNAYRLPFEVEVAMYARLPRPLQHRLNAGRYKCRSAQPLIGALWWWSPTSMWMCPSSRMNVAALVEKIEFNPANGTGRVFYRLGLNG